MEKKRSILRSPGILLVALVVLIAATGLVYAHWTTTLRVDANVYTGGLHAAWLDTYTNDDGVDNGDGELTTDEAWDGWGDESSRDPSVPGFFTDNAGNRYDKDVARCYSDTGGDTLNIYAEHTYPSYHCAVHGELANKGNVPVRVTAINAEAWFNNRCGYWEEEYGDPGGLYEGDNIGWDDQGPFYDDNMNGEFDGPDYRLYEDCRGGGMDFVPGDVEGNFALAFQGIDEIEGDIALGLRCGFQIDPIPCEWLFVGSNDPWSGNVGGCSDIPGDESQCAFSDDWSTNHGEVYESCGGPTYGADGWFHVLQEADQNTAYQWSFGQDFVNWNEWGAEMCTEGSVVVHPDGTPYGIANGTPDPDPLP